MLAVLAILAGAAIALLSDGCAETTAREAAERVAGDLRYVQAAAVAGGAGRSVEFAVEEDGYRAYATDDGTTLTQPVSKLPFEVRLADLFPGARVDLVAADFCGGSTVSFGAEGAPVAGGSLLLSAGRKRFAVDIAAGSGRIVVHAAGAQPADQPVAN